MSLTDRDRKVLLFVVPVLVILAYWMLLLSPQRRAADKAADEVATQQGRRDTAQARLDAARNAKGDFSADYTQIVRLGKAIPATVDMPSLIVQLDGAAQGTGIRFTKIKTGERVDSATGATATPPPTGAPAPSAPPGTAPPGDSATPAAAGGDQAQSAPGGAVEAANNTAQSVAFSREAASAGAAGLLVVSPYYNKPTPNGLVAHLSAIAEATGVVIRDLPLTPERIWEAVQELGARS